MLVFERCLFKRIYRIWAELPVPQGTGFELRRARCFGTTAQFWLNPQAKYDLAISEEEKAAEIAREVLPLRQAT